MRFGLISAVIVSIFSTLLVGHTQAQTDKDLTIATVLSKHITAMGGREAIESIENLRIHLVIEEPEFTLRGDYRVSNDGMMRIDVYDGESTVFSEGVDEFGGWQQFGEATPIEDLSTDGYAALVRGIDQNLYGLLGLTERGHTADLLESITHSGVNYQRVRVIMNDGFERHYFINPETWLIDYTRVTSALHPDLDPEQKPVESYNSEFMDICGVKKNRRIQSIELRSGDQIQQSTITDSQCNLGSQQLDITRPKVD